MPVDFSEIQKEYGIKEVMEEKGDILGAVAFKDDQLAIFYKANDSENRQRFTIAHEIAHCCINPEELVAQQVCFRFENFNKTEWQKD